MVSERGHFSEQGISPPLSPYTDHLPYDPRTMEQIVSSSGQLMAYWKSIINEFLLPSGR